MRVRHWFIAGLGAALLLFAPAVATAGPEEGARTAATATAGERTAGGPHMLAYNASSRFVRRPATVVPFGNGAAVSTVIGRLTATEGDPIRWRRWSRTSAYGRGTMWFNDMDPSIAEGHWNGYAATLYAHRVVQGRYTLMTLRTQIDGEARTWNLRLVKLGFASAGKSVYAWRTVVQVPSWRDFRSAYTGDDWVTILESLQEAIEIGFADVGLIADVEYLNGHAGARAYQRPRAGARVLQGTTVRIGIPVYD